MPVNAEVHNLETSATPGQLAAGDTTYCGNYFTGWKKQKDGSWKVTLDGGNATPKPQ